ncbi:hypothetical protein AKUH1B104J_11340 [Apilactobacillus kunkeei]|nr:hypothetical protein AKUH1B104J_11340 [Apilactobacillus kunkeei]
MKQQITDAQNNITNLQNSLASSKKNLQYYSDQKDVLQKQLDAENTKANSISDSDPSFQQVWTDFYAAQYAVQDNDS